MKLWILAIDPGGTTGWALFHGCDLIACGEIPGGRNGFKEWALASMPAHDALVAESFIVEPDFVGRADASEVIGVAYALSKAKVFREQLRSAKATLVRGSETHRFNWLRERGFDGSTHTLDAITHALLYLRAIGDADAVRRYWYTTKAPA